MSETRSLGVLEILVHLPATIPDRYLLGTAEVANDVAVAFVNDDALPA
jgi:hypothetical protein